MLLLKDKEGTKRGAIPGYEPIQARALMIPEPVTTTRMERLLRYDVAYYTESPSQDP